MVGPRDSGLFRLWLGHEIVGCVAAQLAFFLSAATSVSLMLLGIVFVAVGATSGLVSTSDPTLSCSSPTRRSLCRLRRCMVGLPTTTVRQRSHVPCMSRVVLLDAGAVCLCVCVLPLPSLQKCCCNHEVPRPHKVAAVIPTALLLSPFPFSLLLCCVVCVGLPAKQKTKLVSIPSTPTLV